MKKIVENLEDEEDASAEKYSQRNLTEQPPETADLYTDGPL
jgi:hypothetical protein